MNIRSTIFATSLFLLCSVSFFASASEGKPLVFYRDSAGAVSKQSKNDAVEMRKVAAQDGYITIWLLADYPFNVYRTEMTDEEIDAQRNGVASEFAEILDPLVADGRVHYPKAGPLIKGPGCLVRDTVSGLNALLNDERIVQITGTM